MEKENYLALIACVEHDVNPDILFYKLKKEDEKTLMRQRPGRKKDTHEDEIKRYHNEGYNDPQIAEKVGISKLGVKYYRDKLGLEPNGFNNKGEKDDIRMIYYKDGYSDIEIARMTGESYSGIWRWRQRNGLPSNAKSKQKEKDKTIQKYYEKGLNDSEIARATGYTALQVRRFRKKYGLESNYERGKTNDKT